MNFADLSFEEIIDETNLMGLPKFRGNQVFDAIVNGQTLDQISVFSSDIKNTFKNFYPKYHIYKKFISKDGTIKYLIEYEDKSIVECVLMKYKYGNTICVSSQVGCRMGCRFCASTLNGLRRNLSAGEILGQIYLVNKDLGGSQKNRAITNIVLMGSGEPLDNFENVCKFIELISSPKGLNISKRNISISTCGIVEKIYMLADKNWDISLTISLHATLDSERKKIMPIANKYSIDEIIKACDYFFEKTKRRYYIEYTLIKDINDSEDDIKRLAKFFAGKVCHINLIMLNPVKERNLLAVEKENAQNFKKKLNALGVSATIRRSMGQDISGACGQLRNKFLKDTI